MSSRTAGKPPAAVDVAAEVVEGAREELHELVAGVLGEGVGDVLRRDGAELGGVHGPWVSNRSRIPAAIVW